MSSLTIPLPDKLKGPLAAAARKHRVSPARFVLKAIESAFQREALSAPASLYDLSRDLCGSVKGAPRDLARHGRHLEGYGAWKR